MRIFNNRLLKNLLLGIAVVGIASCGEKDNSTLLSSPETAAAGVSAHQQNDPKIIAYGPKGTEVAKPFNVQPSGESALWVKLDHPAVGADAAIWWGDQQLDSSASGDTITAVVPARLYANVGRYSLQVRANNGTSAGTRSSVVDFTVK